MSFTLTARDVARLKCLHPDLRKVVLECAKITSVPFMVMETERSIAQQEANIKSGVSWTKRSRHIKAKDGLVYAADLVPLADGKPSWSWPIYHKFAPFMWKAAKNVGVTVEWGGLWEKTPDGPHWQLAWAEYPGK